MATLEERLAAIERELRKISNVPGSGAINLSGFSQQVRSAYGLASALQGFPAASATVAIPHNDSWIFEDNVDATHAANLRYIIAKNVTRVVSARLSIHLAPYRTYSTLTLTSTGTDATGESGHSHSHNHGSHFHGHNHVINFVNAVTGNTVFFNNPALQTSGGGNDGGANLGNDATATTPSTDSTGSSGHSHSHSHTVSGSSILGVSEGATATGVTLTFDGGPDKSGQFGGPFTTDQIELDVRPFLVLTQGVWHTIAMQPSGLGRIEAHLRLGVYVSAGQIR